MAEVEPPPQQRAGGGAGGAVMAACLVLVSASAVGALVRGPLSGFPMPQPGLPGAVPYFAQHTGSAFVVAASYLVAAAALYVFGAYVPVVVVSLRRVRLALLLAVFALVVAAVAGLALAILAPVAGAGPIHALHAIAWLSGGILHLGTLGLYLALLARSLHWRPALRVAGTAIGWCAVVCLVVLVAPGLSPFATAARVACLAWMLLAAHQSAFGTRS